MDNFNIFINTNAHRKSAQYITSRQKVIARLLKKDVFKVVILDSILSNAHILNSYFDNKIKNLGTAKSYEKI